MIPIRTRIEKYPASRSSNSIFFLYIKNCFSISPLPNTTLSSSGTCNIFRQDLIILFFPESTNESRFHPLRGVPGAMCVLESLAKLPYLERILHHSVKLNTFIYREATLQTRSRGSENYQVDSLLSLLCRPLHLRSSAPSTIK